MVNVEFEWFNFDPEIDFQGLKTLLRQLLDVDASLFEISGLADLILSQPTIGSTVKVEGKANDAYAFLTALNLQQHKDNKAFAALVSYIVEKAGTNEKLSVVRELVTSGARVGLVLAERLVNMPSEIAPPMYSMLIDEIEAAVEDQEPYEFSHYLILSKTYHGVQSILEDGERKRKKAKDDSPLFYFHPEDEVLQKYAVAFGTFPFTKDGDTVADSKRAFQDSGIKSQGSMIIIEAAKFEAAAKAVSEYLGGPS